MGAVMRKLLHIICGVLKSGKPFDPAWSTNNSLTGKTYLNSTLGDSEVTKMTASDEKRISQKIIDFYRTKNILCLFAAFILIIEQKRFLEIAYGIFCFLFCKPGRIEEDLAFQLKNHITQLEKLFVEKRKQKEKVLLEVSNQLSGGETTLYSTDHGYVITEAGFILGEYDENAPRIFVKSNDEFTVCQFYQTTPGVRHIHSILKRGEHLFVSTGDSNKFLDRWKLSNGHIRFEKRVLRKFGGFTACCIINGKTFFGTDFSERPNYIFCLETRQKWFFPKPAYTQYCYLMLPLIERYLFCFNKSLSNISNQRTMTVFDAETLSFVYCQDYLGHTFLCDHRTSVYGVIQQTEKTGSDTQVN